MGTTLTALQAGSTSYAYIALIEGYRYALTSADPATAVTALAGTDWTLALGGLFVEAQHEQQINPWEPFNSGGRCVLKIAQTTTADTFGVDVHRKGGSDETTLMVELDRNDTQVEGKSTALFDATGEIHIGTECIAYTGKTATPAFFTGCTRGKYSPFAADGSETMRFGNYHRVGLDAQSVKLQPVISSIPRVWAGRRVGVWIHRVVNGVLDVKAQAHLVFAGRIVDTRDDPSSLGTIVECEHVLDEVKESPIGVNLWSAKIKPGIYLSNGMTFGMNDSRDASIRTANPLTVVVGGATGANQMNVGFYSHDELFSKIQAWWTSESTASRLWGSYAVSISEWDGELRTKIFATISAPVAAGYEFRMPKGVACLLGYSTAFNPSLVTGTTLVARTVTPGVENVNVANDPPLRLVVLRGGATIVQFDWNRVELIDERGTFFDQFNYWPAPWPGGSVTSYDGWGIFIVDGKILAFGNKNGDQLGSLLPLALQFNGVLGAELGALGTGSLTDVIEIRQLMILEGPLFEIINKVFYSTGTPGYNHATYDVLPSGMGIAIPADLLGIDFEAAVAALPGASNSTVVVVDEPTTLAELFGGDFVLRRAFTLWKEGHIKFGTWRAPVSGDAIHTLEEANKAEPAGSDSNDKHRSASTQTTEWVRSVVKVDYNRDILAVGKDTSYFDSITFEDATAVDDAGGRAKLFTIKARNTFGQLEATGVGINSIAPEFLAFLPMVSRPAWKIRRSIDCRYFEGLSVGDIVLFTDEFARDPVTGTRGITARPAIVTMHKWGIGGSTGGDDVDPMGGEIELFFTDVNPTLQSAPYAPAADVDYAAVTGGYDAGYSVSELKLRCFPHSYSQTVDGLLNGSPIVIEDPYDASRFVAGHKIKIIERDPIDLTAPVIWERTVASQTGNDIVLTTALSSPAWDNTKKYRVAFDDYNAIVSAQQAWAFSASSVDGLILDTAQPYLYGSGTPPGSYEANPAQSAQELVELMPDIVPLDGAGRDVGYEKQLIRLVDCMIDYKATSAPMLFDIPVSNTTYVGSGFGFQLVAATPIYLTDEMLSGSVRRELSAAPMFRSLDGRAVFLRVSIYRNRPTASTVNDQSPGTVYDGVVFETTSTAWVIPSPDVLFAEIKNNLGMCWLQIECSYYCETRGLARFSEGPRST